MSLNRLKTRVRMGLGFGTLVILFVVTISFSLIGTRSISSAMKKLYTNSYAKSTSILQIDATMSKIQFFLSQSSDADEEVLAAMIKEIEEKNARIDQLFSVVRALCKGGDVEKLDLGMALFKEWQAFQKRVLDYATEGNIIEADDLVLTEGKAFGKKLDLFTSEFITLARTEASDFMGSAERAETTMFRGVQALALGSLAAGLFIVYLLSRSILVPVASAVAHAKRMATGDFTERSGSDATDEFGELAHAMDATSDSLGAMIQEVKGSMELLLNSSQELTALSGTITEAAITTSQRSESSSVTIQKLGTNVGKVGRAMETTSKNTETVASATAQMSSTIREIAEQSSTALSISASAVELTAKASGKMEELEGAAREISKVTETINDISEQTNLLALNATIEAARAGEAGRGFAVVANEIKELSKQTALATQEIESRIHMSRETTRESVEHIKRIVSVINEVDDLISVTAASVEEQSVATQDIMENITTATQAISQVGSVASDNSSYVRTITQEVGDVRVSAMEMSENSGRVNQSSINLRQLADRLSHEMERFKIL